eukprot:scaffold248942_cov43-Attheya_sp.AAC.1
MSGCDDRYDRYDCDNPPRLLYIPNNSTHVYRCYDRICLHCGRHDLQRYVVVGQFYGKCGRSTTSTSQMDGSKYDEPTNGLKSE